MTNNLTQKERVEQLLIQNGYVCGSEFLKAYLPEYRSLLAQMKKVGKVQNRICKRHKHQGLSKEWSLVGTGTQKLPTCCTSYIIFKEHSRDCKVLHSSPVNVLF